MPGPHYKQTAVAIILIFFAIGLSAASVGAADSLTVVTHVRIGPRLDAGVDQLVFAGIATSPSVADAEIALVAVRTQDSWFGDHWDLRLRLPGHELTLASDSIDRKLIRPGQSYKAVLSVNRATGEVSAGLWNLDSGQELASGFWYAEELPDAEHVVSGAVSDTEGAVLQTVSAQAASGYERLGAPLALRGARAAIRRPGAAISHTILDWKATDAYLEIDGIDGRLPGSIVVDVIYPDGASRRHELEPGPRVTVPVPADQGPPGRYGAKISYNEPGYTRQLFGMSWEVVLPDVQVRFDIPEAFAFLKGDVSGPIEGSLKVTSSHALSDVSIVVTNGFGEELVRRSGLTLPAGLSEWPFVIGQGHEGTEGASTEGASATMPGAGTAEDGD
ncbi:MAG: hypothetical protein GX161_13790, partial [Firmicutes bacterium]|nr:hypothetical protein [Bacillota bacterium]